MNPLRTSGTSGTSTASYTPVTGKKRSAELSLSNSNKKHKFDVFFDCSFMGIVGTRSLFLHIFQYIQDPKDYNNLKLLNKKMKTLVCSVDVEINFLDKKLCTAEKLNFCRLQDLSLQLYFPNTFKWEEKICFNPELSEPIRKLRIESIRELKIDQQLTLTYEEELQFISWIKLRELSISLFSGVDIYSKFFQPMKNSSTLEVLELVGLPCEEIASRVHGLTALKKLTAIGCGITEIPTLSSNLKELTIDLRDCNAAEIAKLPQKLEHLSALRTLTLKREGEAENNNIVFPATIYSITQLQSLHLEDVISLSIPLQPASHLTTLKISGVLDDELTEEYFSKFPNLKHFRLDDAGTHALPQALYTPMLEKLSRVFNGGDVIPFTISPSIENCQNLTNLVLSSLRFTHLPQEIGLLTNLIRFDLNASFFYSLPNSLINLEKLKYLDISDCNNINGYKSQYPAWFNQEDENFNPENEHYAYILPFAAYNFPVDPQDAYDRLRPEDKDILTLIKNKGCQICAEISKDDNINNEEVESETDSEDEDLNVEEGMNDNEDMMEDANNDGWDELQ